MNFANSYESSNAKLLYGPISSMNTWVTIIRSTSCVKSEATFPIFAKKKKNVVENFGYKTVDLNM